MANLSMLCRFNGSVVGLSFHLKTQPHECLLRASGARIRCSGVETPPESREQAISQAAGSLSRLLEKALKQRGPTTVKQRREQRQMKLRVDLPVLDDALDSLLSSLSLSLSLRPPPTIAVFSDGLSSSSSTPHVSFHSLDSATTVPADVALVVVAGARSEDTTALQLLARNVSPRPLVVINPEWSPEDEDNSFLASFETAYAFLPLSIQGFLTKSEAAVLKSGQQSGWLIFVKEGGKFSKLSTLKRRPGPAELESALYNAMAANSPVTKSIRFLRGLVSKD